MVWFDIPFWVVGGVASGFFGLRAEVMIDARSVRHCTYIKLLNQPIIFCEN